jgi:hypothetical protein
MRLRELEERVAQLGDRAVEIGMHLQALPEADGQNDELIADLDALRAELERERVINGDREV